MQRWKRLPDPTDPDSGEAVVHPLQQAQRCWVVSGRQRVCRPYYHGLRRKPDGKEGEALRGMQYTRIHDVGHVYHVDNITYSTSRLPALTSTTPRRKSSCRLVDFTKDAILEDFNKREWIYLYLKKSAATTREEAVAAYCYPLIPHVSKDNIPWRHVPLGGSQQPGRNYHFDDVSC